MNEPTGPTPQPSMPDRAYERGVQLAATIRVARVVNYGLRDRTVLTSGLCFEVMWRAPLTRSSND